MNKALLSLAGCAILAATPSYAQSETQNAPTDAAVDAMEGAAEAVEAAADATGTAEAAVTIPSSPRNPRLKNYSFIRQVDYPIDAWQADESGPVRYSVEVSVEGKPVSCEITEGSDLTRLAAATCPLVMERANFRPAIDENGEETAGTYEGVQNWRKREPELPQMALIFQYLHDENGVSRDCKFLKMENLPEKMRKDIERDRERDKLCPGPSTKQGIPYRDENGVPIAKLVTISMDVQLAEPTTGSPE